MMGKNTNSAKYPILPITERLKGVFSIICFVSNADSPDTVVEDIAALSVLSPNCEVIIVSETEMHGVFNLVVNLKEIVVIPDEKDKAALNQFLKDCVKINTDILYCRNAEESAFVRKCMTKINVGLVIIIGNSSKKTVFKGQVLRIEDEDMTLKDAMPFIPGIRVDWKLSAEVLSAAKTFLKEREVKKKFFCVDRVLEEEFYDFFSDYEDEKVSFLFIGNTDMGFSNEKSKILYCGDISDSYLSALVSLSNGCLVMENDFLLAETQRFQKRFLQIERNSPDFNEAKRFIDENK